MILSSELISQFVKVTNDKPETKNESTVYGTIVSHGDKNYVQLDGSDLLTPISSISTNVRPGERVAVMIKNHTANVTGNLSSPAARFKDIGESEEAVLSKITEFEIIIAGKVDTDEFTAETARINALAADNIKINKSITAAEGDIDNLQASTLEVTETLEAAVGDIGKLKADKLDASVADLTFATIKSLDATNVDIHNLEATYAEFSSTTTTRLVAVEADISDLETKKLDAEQASMTYANIDFSNISKAAMEYFYAASGLIDNVVIGDGTITGLLVGVTITGDLIEGNTVVADKLVIKGEDGLYYKLNTDGVTTSAEQTDYNSLNGQVIKAKSITAEKVNVNDLVAFDATIGGFSITSNSIYSEVKDSSGNTTRGIYMDTDGQINFGDETNFIKYYRDDDGNYKLAISAESILYTLNGTHYSIADLGQIGDYIHIGTYEGEPCIELGESDSDFRLIITNTRIMFMEGADVPAYINNQSLHIKKAVIEEELQQGNFAWKIRSNGNMGLVWKGET